MAAVPGVILRFHLDDEAADALFSGVIPPLPQRDPPGRLYWPKSWAVGLLIAVMLALAIGLASLNLSWPAQLAAVGALAIVLAISWSICRPIFEEPRRRSRRV